MEEVNMKVMITGHRIQKLNAYDCEWIQLAIEEILTNLVHDQCYVCGYSGMASGVDLWFCDICRNLHIPYVCCVPFQEQSETMSKEDKNYRQFLIEKSQIARHIRNSQMIEEVDIAIVVWDGNKGGTHNCLQQLIERKMDFYWINPVKQTIIKC